MAAVKKTEALMELYTFLLNSISKYIKEMQRNNIENKGYLKENIILCI